MKTRFVLMGVLFLLFCSIASARVSVITKANEFRIDLVRYDPSPVQPGAETRLWFEIVNLGSTEINNFKVKLVEDYPFTLLSDREITIETLAPGEKKEFSYLIAVNKNAIEDSYKLYMQYYSEKMSTYVSQPINIAVKKAETEAQSSVEIGPSSSLGYSIEPGKTAEVIIKVKNNGNSEMRNVIVSLDISASSTPFATIGMTSEQKIKSIAAGSEESVVFNLAALPEAAAGIYKVPVEIKYYDEQGYYYESSSTIGLIIGENPKLKVIIENSELTTKNKLGKITLKVINYGTTDLKFVQAKLLAGEGYEIISKDEAYLGDIDSDDYDSADFRIKMLSNDAELKVKLDYKDANNNQYSEEKAIGIKLYKPSELGIKQSYSFVWLIAIALAIALYIGYRKFKKHRHKQ